MFFTQLDTLFPLLITCLLLSCRLGAEECICFVFSGRQESNDSRILQMQFDLFPICREGGWDWTRLFVVCTLYLTYLRTYLPTCLPTYLTTYLPAYHYSLLVYTSVPASTARIRQNLDPPLQNP
jgi:hypothetical protein